MSQLVSAVRFVASGAVYLSSNTAYRVAQATAINYHGEEKSRVDLLRFVSLSASEQDVIRRYLACATLSDTAEKFKRSIKTISSQKASAFRKRGVMSNNGVFRNKHLLRASAGAQIQPTNKLRGYGDTACHLPVVAYTSMHASGSTVGLFSVLSALYTLG